ncbi:hypothetical protein J6590_092948, partial [Homalodisca vitripennis]
WKHQPAEKRFSFKTLAKDLLDDYIRARVAKTNIPTGNVNKITSGAWGKYWDSQQLNQIMYWIKGRKLMEGVAFVTEKRTDQPDSHVKHKYQKKAERRNEVKRNHMIAECSVRRASFFTTLFVIGMGIYQRIPQQSLDWRTCQEKLQHEVDFKPTTFETY